MTLVRAGLGFWFVTLMVKSRFAEFSLEFLAFVRIHVRSAIFPLLLFAAIGFSMLWTAGLPRYDFIFLSCLFVQVLLLLLRLETWRELAVLSLFHLCGLCLELYKVSHGSWTYPDSGNWRLGPVPIYSGFMYASVASYMLQAWRHFQLRIEKYPVGWMVLGICLLIYANFFLNKFWPESRWFVVLLVLVVFWRTKVTFVNRVERHSMPLNMAYFLLGLFVWFAEHICSALGAYQYPYQASGWTWVDPGKLTAWCLLVVVCFSVVAYLRNEFRGPKVRNKFRAPIDENYVFDEDYASARFDLE